MPRPLSKLPGSGYLTSLSNTTPVRHTRRTAIVSRDVAGETSVVPICRGVGDLDSVYTFNPVGRRIGELGCHALRSGCETGSCGRSELFV